MSIIDQIGDIEEQLQQIRKNGNQDIVNIKTETDKKKQQMQQMFAQELQTQQEQLTQEMMERIENYKTSLINNEINIKEKLEKQYQSQKNDIMTQVCQDFWRE